MNSTDMEDKMRLWRIEGIARDFLRNVQRLITLAMFASAGSKSVRLLFLEVKSAQYADLCFADPSTPLRSPATSESGAASAISLNSRPCRSRYHGESEME